jgi:TolB-like protein/Tfp pilus assembly protein PilF
LERDGAPEELGRIAQRCLEKDRERRYQTMRQVVIDLENMRREVVIEQVGASSLLRHNLPARQPGIRSLVVLPLENLSGNPEEEYFADGMHFALIGELARISALRVISRQSAMRYKGSGKSIPEIAQELNVDGVVEASAYRDGAIVRIQAHLIQALPVETSLWTQTYERDMRKVLAIHSDVARAIAREIKVKLTPEEERRLATPRQVNREAYEAYLKGMFHWRRLTREDLDTALSYFELARKMDPDYALAYAGISLIWIAHAQMGFVPVNEAAPLTRAAAIRAVELDRALPEVYYSLALLRYCVDWNWEGAETAFQRALEINPNYAEARAYYSHLLHFVGRSEEAMAQIHRALELDPFNSLLQALYAMDLMYARRYDDAIAMLNNTLRTTPNDPVALSTLRSVYHQKRMYEEALEIWKTSYAARGDDEAIEALAQGYAEAGYPGALSRMAETLITRSRTNHVTPWQIGTIYTRAGKTDEAMAWLEKAYEARDQNMPYISVDPIFDGLRDHPRFQELLRRMNLPQN